LADVGYEFHPAVAAWFEQRFPSGPTQAQAQGWPAIASGKDTLIAAPTGSGKTLAGFLIAISGLYQRHAQGQTVAKASQVVYVSPLKALATEGRIVVIGVGAGAEVSLNLALLMVKRVRLLASTLRPRSLEQRAAVARRLERHVLPLVEAGQIQVPIARTFPLAEAAAAYEYFAVPGKLGKVVLIP